MLVITGDAASKVLESAEEVSRKKEKGRSILILLLHSAAQLAELRTCRSVENVTSPISKRQPLAKLEKLLPPATLLLACQ